MKKIYSPFLFILFSLVFLVSGNAKAQVATDYQELIVQVPAQISREFAQLKSDILALGNIQYVDYCASQQCFMLKVDRLVHVNDAVILDLLKSKNLPFEVKTGATISQAMSQCASNNIPASEGK
jgi:hypothetical protein